MQNLNEKVWIDKKIPEIFEHIQRGKRLKKSDHVLGKIPYVSSTANNNGVDNYIKKIPGTRAFSNCISLANSGSVGVAFYEPFYYIASDHVTALKKEGFTVLQYLFLTSVIKKQKVNFNFNREISDKRISNMRILLPVADNGEPNYKYMEQYAATIREKKLSRYRKYIQNYIKELGDYIEIPSLDEKQWKAFVIDRLFDSIIPGEISNVSQFIKDNNGSIEYIAATNRNNGVLYFLQENEQLTNNLQNGNCIGFIKDGDGSAGYAIYKQEKFVSTVNVLYGYATWLNKYTGLFFVTAQDKIKDKYGHGYKRNKKHLKSDKIMLPITNNGEPDFKYMEQYSKNMMLRKYKQYLTFLDIQN